MARIFLAIALIIGTSGLTYAQCEDALITAREEFNSGNVERIPAILHDCLGELSKENQVEAYKMLSITYLYLDDPIGAESSFLALLEIDPEFTVSETDPIELHYLSKQYITTPIISYALKGGGNISTATVLHTNAIDENPNPTTKYKVKGGFNVQGGFDLHFNKMFSLMVDLELSMWQYNKTSTLFSPTDPQELSSVRSNFQGSLPIALKYTYPGEKSFPYIYAGYSPSYTFLSLANESRKPAKEAELKANGLDLLQQINSFNQSLIFGLGLKKRIGQRFGYQYVMVDLRYRAGITNITNEQNQFDFSNPDNVVHVWEMNQVDDDYRWNSIELTVGYVWPQYRPRAKNTVTLQTVIKNLFTKKEKSGE